MGGDPRSRRAGRRERDRRRVRRAIGIPCRVARRPSAGAGRAHAPPRRCSCPSTAPLSTRAPRRSSPTRTHHPRRQPRDRRRPAVAPSARGGRDQRMARDLVRSNTYSNQQDIIDGRGRVPYARHDRRARTEQPQGGVDRVAGGGGCVVGGERLGALVGRGAVDGQEQQRAARVLGQRQRLDAERPGRGCRSLCERGDDHARVDLLGEIEDRLPRRLLAGGHRSGDVDTVRVERRAGGSRAVPGRHDDRRAGCQQCARSVGERRSCGAIAAGAEQHRTAETWGRKWIGHAVHARPRNGAPRVRC